MIPAEFFVSDELVEREVTLADGSKHKLLFKELPHTVWAKFALSTRSEDEDARAGAMAKIIARSVFNADGKPAMTEKQAASLKAKVVNSIFGIILEINGGTDPNALPPGEKSGSGTSSHLPLAEDQ